MVTGEIKWNDNSVGPSLHPKHLAKLEALAISGHAWAKEAVKPDAVRVYASAGGFKEEWEVNKQIICLNLNDLYG